jgi:crotonobetainyl-CoA:carnitine CoA-transferase CaiB-like acyl-CoA transferase
MGEQPLEGIKVLDLAWVVAGPAIGRSLADYGATVVRVESSRRIETARLMGPFPEGRIDPQRSALYDTYNSGKLGLALNLGMEASRKIVRELAQWADVLIESFAPGQMSKWGLAPKDLREANPHLIVLSTSLMGQSGPYAKFAGYGNVGAAIAGYHNLIGREGAVPVGPFGPYTDFVAPRFGLVALLAALDHQRLTGEGCWLDISQVEAGVQFLAAEIAQGAATGVYAHPVGNRDTQYAPHGVFGCAGDDAWLAIVARNDREWARLAELIGGPALDAQFATLASRKAQEDRLEDIVTNWTSTRDAHETERTLQGLGIPAHVAAGAQDMLDDPQLALRGHFVRLPHPLGGDSVVDASRYTLSETPALYERPAPHFGRDTRDVLREILGYPAPRIAELEDTGVLR